MDVMLIGFDPEIPGTSTVPGYEWQIELVSIALPAAKDVGGNAECTVTKKVDETSPRLAQAFQNHTVFRTAEVTLLRDIDKELRPLLKYTMEHVVISSLAVAVAGEVAIETVTMSYDAVRFVVRGGAEESYASKSASEKG